MNSIMDPASILNTQLVKTALAVVKPSVYALFQVEEPKLVWGPKYVAIVVKHPHINDVVKKYFINEEWSKKWGEKEDFYIIATWKAQTAISTGMPTGELVHIKPWEHPNPNYPYAGGVCDGNLGVGVSGLSGYADEIIANLVLDSIKGLSKQKMKDLLVAKS